MQYKMLFLFIVFLALFPGYGEEFRDLEQALFHPEKVVTLDLSYQDFTILPKELMQCVNLKNLNLSLNYITSLSTVEFSAFKQLEYLNISGNLLSSFPRGIDECKNLKILLMRGNSFKFIPDNIKHLKKLELFDISSNPIEIIPHGITELTALKKFYMSNTRITKLPEGCEKFTSLRILDISNSFTEELSPALFALSQLEVLDISGNMSLKILPEEISDLKQLKELYIRNTAIEKLPLTIGELSELKVFDVSYNTITQLPSSFKNLKNLEILDISFNMQIEEFPLVFCSLQRLRVLRLRGCYFKTLPHSIKNLRNLEELDLAFCYFLKNLPPQIGELGSLKTLKAGTPDTDPGLKTIPQEINKLSNLLELDLYGLPIPVDNLLTAIKGLQLRFLFLADDDINRKEKALLKELLPETHIFYFDKGYSHLDKLPYEFPDLRKLLKGNVEALPDLTKWQANVSNLAILNQLLLDEINKILAKYNELSINIEMIEHDKGITTIEKQIQYRRDLIIRLIKEGY